MPPYRRPPLARTSGAGSVLFLPRRSRPAQEDVSRHEVPGAIGVGAKSTARAIATGSVGHRLARPLTLKNPGGCLERKATSDRAWQSSRPRFPRLEMFGWSVVVLVETSTCRSRRGARGRDSSCESSARSGLAGVSHTGENARQLCRPASRDSALRRALARAPGAVPYDGRHLDRGTAAGIDVPCDGTRSGGREWFRSPGSGPGARKGVSEVIDRQRSGEPKKRRSSRPRDAKASRCSFRRASAAASIGPKPAGAPSSALPLEAG
jgi:hypothetical protein